jgi:hypothetical protein
MQTMKFPISMSLPQQAALAAHLVDEINAAYGDDDPELALDMVEAETGFFEAVEAALHRRRYAESVAEGIREAEKRLAARRARFETRAQKIDLAVRAAFEASGLPRLEVKTASFSWVTRAPKAIVSDVSKLAEKFLKPREPSMSAINAAVKLGQIPDGCELNNGGRSVMIREA